MLVTPDLELLIGKAYSEGQACFGDLGLDPTTFAARIQSIIHKHLGISPTDDAAVEFVKSLHAKDLYLATACAQQPPGIESTDEADRVGKNACLAWKILEATYRDFIRNVARLFFRQTFIAQDLADNILGDLFLPDSSGTSRIRSYDGRSSLCTWLRVVLFNRAVNARRRVFAQSGEVEANIPDKPALLHLDEVMRVNRYGTPLADSLEVACHELSSGERLLLLWRYEEGLQLGQIAKLLGIHQSNVTRRLDRMQSKLRDRVVSILSTKHRMSRPAIQECLRDGVENPRHTISILDFIRTLSPDHETSRVSATSSQGRSHLSSSKHQQAP